MSTALSEKIESKIDRALTSQIKVSDEAGGATFSTMVEVMEFSKLMAIGGVALPAFLRNNVGACLAVCIQAIEWRMSPFAVANKSYSVNDRLAFESQLIHAVIEQRAPLAKRLRHEFIGAGESRQCKVIGYVRGEDEPLVYVSPEIRNITPKNSPLWKTKPDLQLFYNASRDWARMHFPDVIMGVYSDDEIEIAQPSGKRPRTLGDLAAKIEQQLEPAVTVEVEQPGPLDTILEQIIRAKDEPSLTKIYDAAIGPDATVDLDDGQRRQVEEARADRLAVLREGAK